MDPKSDRLYPSAPLGNIDLEQRLEKKLKGGNSFNNSTKNIKEIITYFKDKNNKSQKKYKKYNTITTKLKSFDTFVIIAPTSSFFYFESYKNRFYSCTKINCNSMCFINW